MYYNEYVGMALSEEGLRCMALNRGAELPPAAPRARRCTNRPA